MGKKGGGSFYRPVLSSSSGMFAKKGNPWVTRREGERDYDRQVEVENPDMDADRQRHARIHNNFSKEFEDAVRRPIDFKMTMREAIETERSIRMDSYNQRGQTGFKFKKPKAGEWPKAGEDFEVERKKARVPTMQQRLAANARSMNMAINAINKSNRVAISSSGKTTGLEVRTDNTAKIACPYGCGYASHDGKNISSHLRKFRNKSCTHPHSCQCPDCKRSRNEI